MISDVWLTKKCGMVLEHYGSGVLPRQPRVAFRISELGQAFSIDRQTASGWSQVLDSFPADSLLTAKRTLDDWAHAAYQVDSLRTGAQYDS